MRDQALLQIVRYTFMEKSGVEWKVKDVEAFHFSFASKPKELVSRQPCASNAPIHSHHAHLHCEVQMTCSKSLSRFDREDSSHCSD